MGEFPYRQARVCRRLLSDLKFIAAHFPFDAHQKVEVHALGLEPGFQIFAGIGAKLDEHFSLEHVDENTLGACEPAGLHALRENFGSLAGEAGERVLGKVAWHRNSCVAVVSKYSTEAESSARVRRVDGDGQMIFEVKFRDWDNAVSEIRISIGQATIEHRRGAR
jgi:hypothetical protein